MSNEIGKKYAGIKVLANDEMAKSMTTAATNSNQFALEQMFAMSNKGGDIIVCANQAQDAILELVVGRQAPDSAATLYEAHPVFSSPGTLMKAREDVIDAIYKRRPKSDMLLDPIRKRPALLAELGFAQLIDTLKAVELQDGLVTS